MFQMCQQFDDSELEFCVKQVRRSQITSAGFLMAPINYHCNLTRAPELRSHSSRRDDADAAYWLKKSK